MNMEEAKLGTSTHKANLSKARKLKNDEFYTQLTDIEKELKHYKDHFKGKTVYCNCDDPFESNFFKFFALSFNHLGLKKLIATSYAGSELQNTNKLVDVAKKPYAAIVTEIKDENGDKSIMMDDVYESFNKGVNQLISLEGDGDFRSEESIEFLKESDIVVTNPPFSLFREYVAQLVEHDKKFVIMGNKNAITYKEFFPLIKDNKVWVGATSLNGGRWMIMPKNIETTSPKAKVNPDGDTILNVAGVCWFTNLEIKKRYEDIVLVQTYDPNENPAYDNYVGVNVDKVINIPYDYEGVMGVPITFLDKYNPDQFEIIGQMANTKVDEHNFGYPFINGKRKYARILIRNKKPRKTGEYY